MFDQSISPKGQNFMIQFSGSENQLHSDALEANHNIID
jgi:hypothetical protein